MNITEYNRITLTYPWDFLRLYIQLQLTSTSSTDTNDSPMIRQWWSEFLMKFNLKNSQNKEKPLMFQIASSPFSISSRCLFPGKASSSMISVDTTWHPPSRFRNKTIVDPCWSFEKSANWLLLSRVQPAKCWDIMGYSYLEHNVLGHVGTCWDMLGHSSSWVSYFDSALLQILSQPHLLHRISWPNELATQISSVIPRWSEEQTISRCPIPKSDQTNQIPKHICLKHKMCKVSWRLKMT